MSNGRISLITGGNKGLGFETADRLRAAGQTVYIGARDAELGRAAADELAGIGADGPTGTFVDRDGTVGW